MKTRYEYSDELKGAVKALVQIYSDNIKAVEEEKQLRIRIFFAGTLGLKVEFDWNIRIIEDVYPDETQDKCEFYFLPTEDHNSLTEKVDEAMGKVTEHKVEVLRKAI